VSEAPPPPAVLRCDCCGIAIADTEEDNAWYGEVPYPGEAGTGLCRECGGDPHADDTRKRIGFVVATFVDARIAIVAARLSETNREEFLSADYEKQVRVVLRLVARGALS
jgi:hypothetical protein